jgi:hypothetical protein
MTSTPLEAALWAGVGAGAETLVPMLEMSAAARPEPGPVDVAICAAPAFGEDAAPAGSLAPWAAEAEAGADGGCAAAFEAGVGEVWALAVAAGGCAAPAGAWPASWSNATTSVVVAGAVWALAAASAAWEAAVVGKGEAWAVAAPTASTSSEA